LVCCGQLLWSNINRNANFEFHRIGDSLDPDRVRRHGREINDDNANHYGFALAATNPASRPAIGPSSEAID